MAAGILRRILDSPNGEFRRPVLKENRESNIPGLFVIGDLAGAPVVKLAMEQGFAVAHEIAARTSAHAAPLDVVVIGAGAAGLNAALTAQDLGLRALVLEKNKIANTIEEFPEGKWVYAEPDAVPPKGKLWLDGASKEDLIARWNQIIVENKLRVRTGEGVEAVQRRSDGTFDIRTSAGNRYHTRFVVLASGQRGNPRKLGVVGEGREQVYHRLYSPKLYRDEDIVVVGGGNSAVEAALALAGQNRVTLVHRGGEFSRVFKDNARKLAQSNVRVLLSSRVSRFEARSVWLEDGRELAYQHAFVLIGAEQPADFLRSLGLKLENDWTPARYAALACTFALAYTIYGVKQGAGHEYWPYRGWGSDFFAFFGRPWSFWYTVLYTLVMTVFGIQAMRRWGFARKDRFQIWRYVSLIGFQWVFFFLVPEFLFRWTAHTQWIGAALKHDAGNAWRAYGLVYAWPLFFYTFFDTPAKVWIVYGAFLSFVLIPVLVLYHGKRYCSWICGCGGLAETLGDRWRHLAPKGPASIRWERMNIVVLAAAVVITAGVLLKDASALVRGPALAGEAWYHVIADTWLVGILPVALYPFFGGKVWCRYWCPLAKMMELFSAVFARFGKSRFAIQSNEKCIACGECSRNCQIGIDVMQFALKQESIDNLNSSCIGCGICVTVCPMDVLSFGAPSPAESKLVQIASNHRGVPVG